MQIDLATASPDSFAPFVGQEFTVLADGADVPLILEGIKHFERSGIRDKKVVIDGVELPPRQAFALTFVGPLSPELSNGTFPLSHAEIEGLMLFLSPFRRDEDGMLYESVFN